MVDLIDSTLASATLHVLNAIRPMPQREGITLETAFVGAGMRGADNLRYIPCRLSMVPILFRDWMHPHAVVLHTSTPRNGAVSLGIEVNILPAAIEAVQNNGGVVIAMTNPNMPYTLGDSVIDLADIDYLVEVDEPIMTIDPVPADDISLGIGELISQHIHNGSTIQVGIGAVPDAVLQSITHARDLRIWTETFSDGVLALERAGALDPNRPVQTSFMMGSNELYAWVDNNSRLSMMRTERCNDPARIAKNYGMTSVNGALQVDLYGQANASRIKGKIYSGFGGSTDFIVGALHAPHGHSFMALPSWHPRAKLSTIVPELDAPATNFQQTAVVTEQGIAWLFGVDEREQASNLIENAAHPGARDYLREAMSKMPL